MADITAANSVYILSIAGLFPPIQLQGFAAEDVFDTEILATAEVLMGVDGVMSAGFVFVPTKQTITLQADSASVVIFEQWQEAQKTIKGIYSATGLVTLPAIGRKYALTNGVLTSMPQISDVKKVLQPRKFGITWQDVSPAPF
jgi:hypothetical protein